MRRTAFRPTACFIPGYPACSDRDTGSEEKGRPNLSKEPPLPKPTTMKQESVLHSKQPTPCSTMKYRIEIDGTDARDIQYITFRARGCAHFSGARTFLSAGGFSGGLSG